MSRTPRIAVVAHEKSHEPRVDDDGVIVSRTAYSIDGYSPVMVTIRVLDTYATVQTTMIPDGLTGWWREPTATMRRMMVDRMLEKEAPHRRRSGPVQDLTADQWFHRYPLASTYSR